MKVAILLPGLVRTYKKTHENFFSNIIEPNREKHEIDTYLAFWDHTHERGDYGNRNRVRKLQKNEIDQILQIYRPKEYSILDDYHNKNDKEFSQITYRLTKIIGKPHHPDGNKLIQNGLVAQSYSWFKAFSLVQESYDLVFKTRFDLTTSKVFFEECKPAHFNCAGSKMQFPQFGLADHLFAGDSKVMEIFMNDIYLNAVAGNFPNISAMYRNVFPEFVFKSVLQSHKIPVNYLNKQITIVR